MDYHANDWLGRWQNFESYLTSADPVLMKAWQEAEEAVASMKMPMFRDGAKTFWQKVCVTSSPENPCTLGGWNITPAEAEKLCIEWLDADGNPLGKAVYHVETILQKGLEGKENLLFVAEAVPENWPFRCLLAMEPMPPRTARQNGALLSHLHFQYASNSNKLFDPENGKLHNPMWYATMCDGDGTRLEQCNIVRALHQLPVWDELPELCSTGSKIIQSTNC